MKRWAVVALLLVAGGAGLLVAWLAWLAEIVERAQRVIDHRHSVRPYEPFTDDWSPHG